MKNLIVVALLALGSGCCVSKEELSADVAAWRSFTDAVEPDLAHLYAKDPIRLRALEDNRAAIAAATSRATGVK